MGYDVTNNSSIIELGEDKSLPSGNDIVPIQIPSVSVSEPILKESSPIPRGTITIEVEGGVPPYTYSIDGINYQVSNVFTNVKNNITVYVKDSVGTIITIKNIDSSPYVIYKEGVTSIPIPTILPDNSLIQVDNLSQSDPIVIPEYIPPDGVILLEGITIPISQLPHTSLTGGDKYYVHNQGIESEMWDIRHNLAKKPSVHIEDMSGNEMIPQIIHISNNHAKAIFGRAYSGTAHCN